MNIFNHKTILSACAISLSVILSGCGDKDIADAYRYDHVDRIAAQYADMLTSPSVTDRDLQLRLMDINSRCHRLNIEGDSLLALFFRYSIEDKVRALDAVFADSIFSRPSLF